LNVGAAIVDGEASECQPRLSKNLNNSDRNRISGSWAYSDYLSAGKSSWDRSWKDCTRPAWALPASCR